MKKFLFALVVALMALSEPSFSGTAERTGWTTDYKKALGEAKAGNKLVVLDFNGSDWCEWCIKLREEVFSKPEFQNYASRRFVLVDVDFPLNKEQSEALKEQNEALQKKFGVEVFPTVVVLNSSGKKIGELNYVPGGPKAFLMEIAKMKKD